MKSYLLVVSLVFGHLAAQACDQELQSFPRDCAIQDRYVSLKDRFAAQQINIDEIAEYRVIRFVDRATWERAKEAQAKPKQIYKPAPDTWLVWDSGIRDVMTNAGGKGGLNSYVLNEQTISSINHSLLENNGMNTKDKNTDQSLKPGEFRKTTSIEVGFNAQRTDYSKSISKSEASMDRFQQKWEAAVGTTFSQILKDAGVEKYDGANFRSGMKQSDMGWVSYAESAKVPTEIQWIKTFIATNLELYRKGTPALSPMELAAVVQKWFVSVHPFSDGNGRTSRAIQDIILAHFGMPFVPGGDLQEDATTEYEKYIESTYSKTESILSQLELCQTSNAAIFQCQTLSTIDAMPDTPASLNFNKAPSKKD